MVMKSPISDYGRGTPGGEQGWAQSGNCITGNSNFGVVMSKQFPIMGNYTLQFNVGALPNGLLVRPTGRAFIDWMVAGNAIHREISVFDGASITGTAEAVNVRVVDETNAGVIGPGLNYVTTITIAKGTRGSSKQLPYLALTPQTAAPGSSATFTIPPDVGAISVLTYLANQDPNPVIITGPIPQGTVVCSASSALGAANFDATRYDWTPMPPGASQLIYRVDPGLPYALVRIMPYLGIDG